MLQHQGSRGHGGEVRLIACAFRAGFAGKVKAGNVEFWPGVG